MLSDPPPLRSPCPRAGACWACCAVARWRCCAGCAPSWRQPPRTAGACGSSPHWPRAPCAPPSCASMPPPPTTRGGCRWAVWQAWRLGAWAWGQGGMGVWEVCLGGVCLHGDWRVAGGSCTSRHTLSLVHGVPALNYCCVPPQPPFTPAGPPNACHPTSTPTRSPSPSLTLTLNPTSAERQGQLQIFTP